jgi:MFS family permease
MGSVADKVLEELRASTFESFRHRDYRLFWSGAFVSNIGTWMQNYALGLVVYAFRSSEFDLGVVNFLSGIPVLFLALWAGGLADRVDRKRLIIWTQAVLLVQAAALGWLYNAGQLSSRTPIASLVWVSGLGILGGIMSALAFPSWQSMLPDLVSKDLLLNAIALNSAQFQSARLVGPVLGGALFIAGRECASERTDAEESGDLVPRDQDRDAGDEPAHHGMGDEP